MKLDLNEMKNNSSNLFSLKSKDGNAVIINLNLIKEVKLYKEYDYGKIYFVDESSTTVSYDSAIKLNEFIKTENDVYNSALKLVLNQVELGD